MRRAVPPLLLLSLPLWLGPPGPPQPPAQLAPAQVIRVCGQVAEWPPYLYFRRDGGARTDEVVGFSAEYLRRALAGAGLRYRIDMLPWKRCLESVRLGGHDMLTDAASNAERERAYLVAKPYYAMHLAYFYDKARPHPPVRAAADLKLLRLCAVNGYNYAAFGLDAAQMEAGSQNLAQSFLKLKMNRCDALPERLEIALGYRSLGIVDFARLDIGYELLAELPPSTFHMMVSRRVPYAEELLRVLNEQVELLNSGDGAREIAAKYAVQLPPLPGQAARPAKK
ncbi:hypothetical protein CSQ96_21595 [Janthinobacterium sp. BJB412]|nr:hypothetical protein CSQ96_21595 [Janthinobacterium sp. BJB412]